MPVSDQCSTEREALARALEVADEFLNEALEVREELVEELLQDEEDCRDEVGPPPPEITSDMEAPLEHELERQWEEYEEKVHACVESMDWPDTFNEYRNLMAAWEIAMEEAEALRDELEACLHALNEGIPFA